MKAQPKVFQPKTAVMGIKRFSGKETSIERAAGGTGKNLKGTLTAAAEFFVNIFQNTDLISAVCASANTDKSKKRFIFHGYRYEVKLVEWWLTDPVIASIKNCS